MIFKIIEHFEGCKLKAYKCPAGKSTIGYGTTRYPNGKIVKISDVCTKKEATDFLKFDLDVLATKIKKVSPLVKENEMSALLSFCYNLGFNSNFIKKVTTCKNKNEIWGEFVKYRKIKGDKNGKDDNGNGIIDEDGEMQTLLGLLRRRNCEAKLFLFGKLDFFENLKS